jgi:hypothetical protein
MDRNSMYNTEKRVGIKKDVSSRVMFAMWFKVTDKTWTPG